VVLRPKIWPQPWSQNHGLGQSTLALLTLRKLLAHDVTVTSTVLLLTSSSLGLGQEQLALALASSFWPRPHGSGTGLVLGHGSLTMINMTPVHRLEDGGLAEHTTATRPIISTRHSKLTHCSVGGSPGWSVEISGHCHYSSSGEGSRFRSIHNGWSSSSIST